METDGDGDNTETGEGRKKVKGWSPIVLLNVVGKLADKVVAGKLMEAEELVHKRAWAGWNGRGAIDPVMLMDELRKETEGEANGRDIKSAFSSMKEIMYEILKEHEDLREWVDHFLRPRTFTSKRTEG